MFYIQFNNDFSFLLECPQKQCRMLCPNGFEKNAQGCEICKCKGKIKNILQKDFNQIKKEVWKS